METILLVVVLVAVAALGAAAQLSIDSPESRPRAER